jgi:hypothetical protein
MKIFIGILVLLAVAASWLVLLFQTRSRRGMPAARKFR